jgi:hypothetical protein
MGSSRCLVWISYLVDLLYPCEVCGHHYEDHLIGLSCAICWADLGFSNHEFSIYDPKLCRRFIGDNLKYLEDKDAES